MQDPDLACREMERCVRDLGLRGVQIGSHVNRWNLDEAALFPVFERAASLTRNERERALMLERARQCG